MNLKTRYTLQIRKYVEGATDAHGNPSESWDDPIDWPVFGLAPGANEDPVEPNRDLSMVLWTVFAPVDGMPGRKDRVIVDGTEYDIEGVPRDYRTYDVFDSEIGQGVVYLKDVEG